MKKYLIMFVALLGFVPVFSANAQVAQCSIDLFIASPATVVAGGSTNINIKTSNCDKATVSGLNSGNLNEGFPVQLNGSVTANNITSPRTFTLQASKGEFSVTKSLTVNTGPVTIAKNTQKAVTSTPTIAKKTTPAKTVAKATPVKEVKVAPVEKKEIPAEVAAVEPVKEAPAPTPTPKAKKKGFFGLVGNVFSSVFSD